MHLSNVCVCVCTAQSERRPQYIGIFSHVQRLAGGAHMCVRVRTTTAATRAVYYICLCAVYSYEFLNGYRT